MPVDSQNVDSEESSDRSVGYVISRQNCFFGDLEFSAAHFQKENSKLKFFSAHGKHFPTEFYLNQTYSPLDFPHEGGNPSWGSGHANA